MEYTKIEYLNRDACNWKTRYEAIISGKMTEEQWEELFSYLFDGEYFLPEAVNFAGPKGPYSEADTPWCELADYEVFETDEDLNSDYTVEELLAKFKELGDNEAAWMKAASVETIYTHNIAANILEMVEDVLIENGIKVPSPDDDQRDPDDQLGFYGETYSGLLDGIEELIKDLLKKHTPITPVITDVFGPEA